MTFVLKSTLNWMKKEKSVCGNFFTICSGERKSNNFNPLISDRQWATISYKPSHFSPTSKKSKWATIFKRAQLVRFHWFVIKSPKILTFFKSACFKLVEFKQNFFSNFFCCDESFYAKILRDEFYLAVRRNRFCVFLCHFWNKLFSICLRSIIDFCCIQFCLAN